MPPKRKSVAGPRNGPTRQQSTLSFAGKNSKVTKSSSPRSKDVKAAKKDPDLVESQIELSDEVTESQEVDAIAEPVKTEDVLGGRAEESTDGAVGGQANDGWEGDEATRARKITSTQINRYWRAKEQERKAPRVHQEGLTTGEKILREWDMSNQFGPAIGISRLKRWKRANMLGLEPPMEVLAVLLKDQDEGENKAQRAYVDELMTSRFVEA